MPLIAYLAMGALAGAVMAAKRPRETERVLAILEATQVDRALVTVAASAFDPRMRRVLKALT